MDELVKMVAAKVGIPEAQAEQAGFTALQDTAGRGKIIQVVF